MPAETIPALLSDRAERYHDKEAIVDRDARVTYAQLETASANLAAALVEAGVNKGHRVGLMMQSGVDWAVNAYAVMSIGAVLVPLSTLLKLPELEDQLRVAGVRHLIAAPHIRGRDFRNEFKSLDRAAMPSLRNIWWSDDPLSPAGDQASKVAAVLAERVKPADEMAVIFTSGSSGEPKGVIHTHGAAIRANACSLAARCIGPDTRLYLPMPLFWAGGFATGLISALNAGCTLLTEAAPEPVQTLQFLEAERVTLFRGWPDQAERIAATPAFASAKLTALQPGSLDAIMPGETPPVGARAPLLGMTESFGPYCGYPLNQIMPQDKWGSCGKPFEGAQVRVVDPESGAPVKPNEEGAIQIGGPNILKGICGREREQVFTPDGWYDTGDMGRFDADGFLFFTGRRDDMVKLGGATAYPSEVEKALESLPLVERAFVCAIECEGDLRFGAAVIRKSGTAHPGELAHSAGQVLSAFKVPRLWLELNSLDDLPLKTSGKVDKAQLRDLIEKRGQRAD